MSQSVKRPSVWGSLVAIGCAYEIVALVTVRPPTITQMMYAARRHYALRFLFWLIAGASIHHFYVEGPAFGNYSRPTA